MGGRIRGCNLLHQRSSVVVGTPPSGVARTRALVQLLGSFDEAGIPVLPGWLHNVRESVEMVAHDMDPTALTWGISIFGNLRSVVGRMLHLACLTMVPHHYTHFRYPAQKDLYYAKHCLGAAGPSRRQYVDLAWGRAIFTFVGPLHTCYTNSYNQLADTNGKSIPEDHISQSCAVRKKVE